MISTPPLDERLRKAVRYFWKTRDLQSKRQGAKTGTREAEGRTAVTGGAQLDGFRELVKSLLLENGVPKSSISQGRRRIELPGWYRPEKQWDQLVVANGELVASMEFKSQVGSFGNNYNNRSEESIGSATDLWAAYREGAFKPSARPWLGYLMLLEEAPGSLSPIAVREPHFKVFPEFRDSSYAQRYEILLTKLVRERLYDAACFLISERTAGKKGGYREPAAELTFEKFISSLLARTTTGFHVH